MSPGRNSRGPGAQKGGGNVTGRRRGRKVTERKGEGKSQGPTSFVPRGARGESRAGSSRPLSLGHSQDWGEIKDRKSYVLTVWGKPQIGSGRAV